MDEQRGPWRVHGYEVRFENPWLRVTDYIITQPDGTPGRYGVVSYANRAMAILPVFEDGTIMLVGQHRFPHDKYSWEIPEGGSPHDEDPLIGARRELREETGLTAETWMEVLRMDLSNSVTEESAIGYIATGLSQGEAEPDSTEVLQTRRLPFRDALDEAMSGRIFDALTVAMLLRAYYMAKEGELEPALAAAILDR